MRALTLSFVLMLVLAGTLSPHAQVGPGQESATVLRPSSGPPERASTQDLAPLRHPLYLAESMHHSDGFCVRRVRHATTIRPAGSV
jgi:hypothetical protein